MGVGVGSGVRVGVGVAAGAGDAVGVGVISSKAGSAVASTLGANSDAPSHPATARRQTAIAANDAANLGLVGIMVSAILAFECSRGPRRFAE